MSPTPGDQALLEPTRRRLEWMLADAQARGRIPSMVAGVVRDGELAWWDGRGVAVRRGPESGPSRDTQYKIGSVTKTMTAALVMLARERGDLTLSDPVARFLPDGPFPDVTLQALLSHSAGITAEPHGSWWERSPGVDRGALQEAHTTAAPVLDPGSRFHYSNLGYGVLGEVVAEIAGTSWYDALAEQLLEPLGMRRTTYQGEEPHAEGFSVDHLTGELTSEPLPDTGAMASAGQLWSTVPDLARWLVALVDPARSVLSAESLAQIRTPQAGEPDDRTGATYGLGVSVLPGHGRVLVGHGGSMPGFCCGVQVDPESGVGAIVLTNAGYGLGPLPTRLLNEVLDREPVPPAAWRPVTGLPEDVRDVVGPWHWGHAPALMRVDSVDPSDPEGVLVALDPVRGPGRVLRFRRVAADTYVGTRGYFVGETMRVVRRPDGRVSHLEVATFVYTRTPYDPDAPIPGGVPSA